MAFILLLAWQPSAHAASPRDTARTQLLALDGPEHRCSLGAGMSGKDGAYVVHLSAERATASPFVLGDRIVGFDGVPVPDTATLMQTLKRTPPDASVAVEVQRDGQTHKLAVACLDIAPYRAWMREVLTSASRYKWDKCVAAAAELGRRYGASAWSTGWRAKCYEQQATRDRHSIENVRTLAPTQPHHEAGATFVRYSVESWHQALYEARYVPSALQDLQPTLEQSVAGIRELGDDAAADGLLRCYAALVAGATACPDGAAP